MILVKGFLRHRSSKIYLSIFTIMLIAISFIYSFSRYYSNIVNETYQKNSYFLVISENNLLSRFKENKHILNVEEVIIISSSDIRFNAIDFNINALIDPDNDYLVIVPSEKLEDNHMILEIPTFIYENVSNTKDLVDEKVFITINGNENSFVINKVNEAHFNRIIISKNIFKEVLSDNYYAYTFAIDDYDQKNKVIEYFANQEKTEVKFIQFYNSSSELDTVESLKNTISLLSIVCNALLVIFIVLFVIVTHNIIRDELDRMRIEQLLGYNKMQVKKYLIMKMTTLNIIIFLVYIAFYLFMVLLVKYFFKISVDIFDLRIIYIVLALFIVSILLSILHRIKKII